MISKGAEDARRDWEQERGCFMCAGDLYSKRPMLNESGFYIRLSPSIDHAADYNAEMARLISELGVPWWLPSNRVPPKEIAQELLRNRIFYEAYRPSNKMEENLILSREANWISEHGCKPSAITHDSDRKVLLISGITPQGYRIDIIDLVFKTWMHTYEAGQIANPK